MVVTKNQIRPRRKKFHFTNADMLGLDTLGLIQLVAPAGLGTALAVAEVQFQSVLVQPYGAIDAAAFLNMFDDFTALSFAENDATSGAVLDSFIGVGGSPGVNLINAPAPVIAMDSFNESAVTFPTFWTDYPDLQANGGIYFALDNGGADLNGGDAGNSMDIFLFYYIVELRT